MSSRFPPRSTESGRSTHRTRLTRSEQANDAFIVAFGNGRGDCWVLSGPCGVNQLAKPARDLFDFFVGGEHGVEDFFGGHVVELARLQQFDQINQLAGGEFHVCEPAAAFAQGVGQLAADPVRYFAGLIVKLDCGLEEIAQ